VLCHQNFPSVRLSVCLSTCLSVYLSDCLSVFLSVCPSVRPFVRPSIHPFIHLWRYSPFVGPWTGDQPVARPLPTHITTQTQNKRTQTSMPRVGFEATIPVFERAKTVHALDRSAIKTLRDRNELLPLVERILYVMY
jgi:hypothetical protein